MQGDSIHVLMIEDDLAYVRLIEELLKESSRVRFELSHVNRLSAAVQLLNTEGFDVVLLDLNLPDSWGFDTFERVHSQLPSVPVVVLTGLEDEELGIKAAQKGGYYLSKGDIAGRLLIRTIQHAIERTRLMADLETAYQKFYHLSAHLQELREEERKRIAGELHDELGGLLTTMKIEFLTTLHRLGDYQGALTELKESLTTLIDRGIDAVQRISADLRPHILDQLGLIPAIEWHLKEFQKRTGIQCHWVLCEGEIPLEKDRALAVFRIVQEALTNVARHAQASRVTVEVSRNEGAMTLKVEDNGVGFNEEKANDPHSFGLIGIQERVLYVKGQVTIKSVPQKGTTVTATIPL
ncbi:MAG: response regulator [Candidatus Methylomirabilis oxyfera]|nr:response regulator [Candidatus Methylomirabilis oxyfera]